MNILAFDTSTEACTVALSCGEQLLRLDEMQPRGHAQRLLPMVEALLAEAGIPATALDAIAYGRGPGSFTGVRIAASAVQGLAFTLEKPVIAVSSLAAMAQQAAEDFSAKRVLTAIDARMNEVYWGTYVRDSRGLMVLAGDEAVLPPEQVTAEQHEDWCAVGTGWGVWEAPMLEALKFTPNSIKPDYFPTAAAMTKLAQAAYEAEAWIAPEAALPVYLRNQVAKKSAQQKT